MKKKILPYLFPLAFSATAALAQTKNNATLPVKSGNEWQMPKDVLKRSRAFANHEKDLLALDSVTTEKFFSLYLGNTKPVDEIRVSQKPDSEKKIALAANQAEFDEKIKALLTAQQYEIYLKDKKKNHL